MKDKVGIGFPHAYRKYIKGGNAVKFNQGMANEVSRYILLFFLFIFYSGIFLASGLLCIYIGEVVIGLLVLPFGLLWLYLLAVGFRSMAAVTLTEDGVYVRVYIRTRFYAWDEIIQTGVLWSRWRQIQYNDVVLLPKGGVPRTYQDKHFVRRNRLKLIHIPYSQEALAYLHKYYGLLDFDLSDGKKETRVEED